MKPALALELSLSGRRREGLFDKLSNVMVPRPALDDKESDAALMSATRKAMRFDAFGLGSATRLKKIDALIPGLTSFARPC
ncbi:hypothetical protein [Thiobacillus sp.]